VISSDRELRLRLDEALRNFLDNASAELALLSTELEVFGATLQGFVLDGGKRLRPAFCYWAHRGTGGDHGDGVVQAAAALELLQAAALIHDDVIDNSDTRRGSPATHRVFDDLHRRHGWSGRPEEFGRAGAILLGDLALVWADAMLAASELSPDTLRRTQPIWAAMRTEVMAGQYLDVVEQSRGGGSVQRALAIARLKSAKYTVERPLHLGAALAGAAEDVFAGFTGFGIPLGEAFQLRDDLLGVFGNPTETGKPAGDDLREGKRTVLVALALDPATEAQRSVLAGIGDPGLTDDQIEQLREVLVDTAATREVESMIEQRVESALRALAAMHIDVLAREQLLDLATAATARVG
jgi:geranylgeranyl diphosphate synthase type I